MNGSTIDWHFYSFSLLQTCFIVHHLVFLSIQKHPNKLYFLTLYIYLDTFYHTLLLHYYTIYKNLTFFSFNVKMFFFLGWKKKRIKCIPFFPQKRQQPTTSQQPQWLFTTQLSFQLAHQQLQFQWQLRYKTWSRRSTTNRRKRKKYDGEREKNR